MVDELSSLMDMLHAFKKGGRSATLTISAKEGQATKVKLEVELDDAKPSPLSSPSTSSAAAPSLPGCQAAGDRLRPRGSVARRAKANARSGSPSSGIPGVAFLLEEVQCSLNDQAYLA